MAFPIVGGSSGSRYMTPDHALSPARSSGRSPSRGGSDRGGPEASSQPPARGGQSRLGPGGPGRREKTVWIGQVASLPLQQCLSTLPLRRSPILLPSRYVWFKSCPSSLPRPSPVLLASCSVYFHLALQPCPFNLAFSTLPFNALPTLAYFSLWVAQPCCACSLPVAAASRTHAAGLLEPLYRLIRTRVTNSSYTASCSHTPILCV